MELTKSKITTTNLKAAKYMEFTVDDDFNVPDIKGDIVRYICGKGQICIEEVEVMNNKIRITGNVSYGILYQTEDEECEFENHEGELPFEEFLNMDGVVPTDKVSIQAVLEDLYVTVINSRKYEVRGLVGVRAWVCNQETSEGATGVVSGSGIECMLEKVCFTNLVCSHKDVMKIKENVEIPANKPNIGEILWDQVLICEVESRITDMGVSVSGKMEIFVMYKPEDEMAPVQYVNATRQFNDTIPCEGATEDMVLEDIIGIGRTSVSLKADDDGEDRVLYVEGSLNLDFKVYEDVEISLLGDMFSNAAQVEPVKNDFSYENLLMRNNAKTRVVKKERLGENQPPILQIMNVSGSVEVDEVKPLEDSVLVEGALKAAILYVSSEDAKPLCQMEVVLPFTYKVETVPLKSQDSIRVNPLLNQLSASLVSSDEIEVKAIVDMGITIFTRKKVSLISDMTISPIDMKEKAMTPGIVGYVVRDGDSIWSIAKRYYSSLDSIRRVNNLENDDIQVGDKILVVKE
jgi:LysM repeat protein